MSSAVLYVAIVAIWAVILLPHWIRRSHSARPESDTETDVVADGGSDVAAEVEADAEFDVEVSVGAPSGAALNQSDLDGGSYGPQYGDDVPDYAETSFRPPARTSAGPSAAGPSAARSDAAGSVATGSVGAGPPASASSTGPSQSRQQMLRSRRRMLTILTALTVLVVGLASLGQLAWWLCVPPTGMLVAYLLLLREIAMADAEMATRREEIAMRRDHALAARDARQRERAAWADSHPEPTAKIIDISSRLGDQLYDQYADAAVRAVGD